MSDLKAQAKLEALWDREPPFPSIPALKDLRLLEHQEFNVHELYVRPPSFGVTCIWYRHHTNRFTSVWEWTPYDPYFEVEAVTSRWIPVTQMTVKVGWHELHLCIIVSLTFLLPLGVVLAGICCLRGCGCRVTLV